MKYAIHPTREDNYPEWYQQVIKAADLAESSDVYGCMVIKPWGYAIWELIQKILDKEFKRTGHKNIYCPLFLPLSAMQKEANHIHGFAKECAVVTHHRLEKNKDGILVPASPLQEPLIIRPTSEAIIGPLFAKWINSYRDLPLLVNQWANVVRWEMRPRMFLRTTEILWQEGHTAHATAREAEDKALQMLDVYANFITNILAIPVIKGAKTESEKFPGALTTYTVEAMMQDKKALQMGTSHFLGQSFSRAFQITFTNKRSSTELVWTTSWGLTTRLIGGLIMTHSDDNGLVLPPCIAPLHVVILPLIHSDSHETAVNDFCKSLMEKLTKVQFMREDLKVSIDDSFTGSGAKAWHWYKKGVPIRIEIGMQEVEKNEVCFMQRIHEAKHKTKLSVDTFSEQVAQILTDMQNSLLNKANKFLEDNITVANSKEELLDLFNNSGKTPGFVLAHLHDNEDSLTTLKKMQLTPRCIPSEEFLLKHGVKSHGKCIISGNEKGELTVIGKSY